MTIRGSRYARKISVKLKTMIVCPLKVVRGEFHSDLGTLAFAILSWVARSTCGPEAYFHMPNTYTHPFPRRTGDQAARWIAFCLAST